MTILELLIVVTIAGILLGIGTPAFQQLVNDTRASTSANRLLSSLRFARAESVRLGVPVTVCPSRNGRQCLASDDAWSEGWLVYRHKTTHGPRRLYNDDQILRHLPGPNRGFRANRHRFTLRTDGRRSTNGTVRVCFPEETSARIAIVVHVMGRARTTREADEMPSSACRAPAG
jgi:type IV fimbrial biogenesis protein FimT